MVEALAFLIFVSGIAYVIIWSVRNDDRVPQDQGKKKFLGAHVPFLRGQKKPTATDKRS